MFHNVETDPIREAEYQAVASVIEEEKGSPRKIHSVLLVLEAEIVLKVGIKKK